MDLKEELHREGKGGTTARDMKAHSISSKERAYGVSHLAGNPHRDERE
jgi:hypothetical protein